MAEEITNEKLDKDLIELIYKLGEVKRFKKEQRLFSKGDKARDFYYILEGSADVTFPYQDPITIPASHLLGEMGLFSEGVRTKDVTALTDIMVIEVKHKDLLALVLKQDSVALKLLQYLGRLVVTRIESQEARIQKLNSHPKIRAIMDTFFIVKKQLLKNWSLMYHSAGKQGKIAIYHTKPSATQADLSIAYSPGVSEPCLAIKENPLKAYDYTSKSHLVGIISNGTAVLGLGNIGALASKPVMEGKAILLKTFADVDAFDIEIEEDDPKILVETIARLEPTFGAINLEDIKAPDCFYVEEECQKRLSIPVFHDDQHGTAIVLGAALLNALELSKKNISDIKVVFSGIGAAGYACANYLVSLGVEKTNITLCDSKGVMYKGRESMNPIYQPFAVETSDRTLEDAIKDRDVFVGLSIGGIVKPNWLKTMTEDPIIFPMANPIPEVDYTEALQIRPDAIIGTGRSDYPNQINNVLAFPYIFRAALDIRAHCINEEMKLAATRALAKLAQDKITTESGLQQNTCVFGPNYILPKPYDKRLLHRISYAIAKAGIKSKVNRIPLNLDEYLIRLKSTPL